MEFFALDIETTGLDHERDQILHIAMVHSSFQDETPLDKLPRWEALIRPDVIVGDAYALNMNRDLLAVLAPDLLKPEVGETREYKGRHIRIFRTAYQAIENLLADNKFLIPQYWRDGRRKAVIAGKNVAGFDLRFLANHHPTIMRRFHHRTIDVGSMALGNDPFFYGTARCS
jgi:DNA polymerase III epsilon subunit-like protein